MSECVTKNALFRGVGGGGGGGVGDMARNKEGEGR